MVSYERLDVFKGFDNFNQKMWDNRVTYAQKRTVTSPMHG
jgi:hypothetical protein